MRWFNTLSAFAAGAAPFVYPADALVANSSINSQTRLAYPGSTSMIVSWNKFSHIKHSAILYGPSPREVTSVATSDVPVSAAPGTSKPASSTLVGNFSQTTAANSVGGSTSSPAVVSYAMSATASRNASAFTTPLQVFDSAGASANAFNCLFVAAVGLVASFIM